MSNSWGRPPRNDIWQDLQALAFWVLLIGVGAYIIFPNFFSDVYARLTDPAAQLVDSSTGSYDPNNNGDSIYDSNTNIGNTYPDTSSGYLYSTGDSNLGSPASSLYLGNEVSTGYWILFVAEGEFKQLAVPSEAYTFLLRLIENDQSSGGKKTVIMVANGQLRKFSVADEIYQIVVNMAAIDTRAKLG
ncbi:MAG: hypothetical protein AB7E31_09990 [Desulfitobacterium sp.]